MRPGRELDALVAEKVMGLEINQDHNELDKFWVTHGDGGYLCPEYSTDIAAAWEVVEKLKTLVSQAGYGVMVGSTPDGDYQCWIDSRDCESSKIKAYSKISAAHAICLAALKTVGVDL